jgi:hypothetical protein
MMGDPFALRVRLLHIRNRFQLPLKTISFE